MARAKSRSRSSRTGIWFTLRGLLLAPLMALATYLGACALLLVVYAVIYPPTTGVQIQRRVEAIVAGDDYTKRYDPVRSSSIARHLPHAVVAAEDGRFFEHGGIDWDAVREAMEDNRAGRRVRGGSTISQQLVKNLFMTTHRSWVRKALEVPLTYIAELILTKDRMLALYLNVIEWGDGVFGAEAAAQHYYGTSASALSRYQAASLAAVIPSPRTRSPQRMGGYTGIILRRMSQMGW